MGRIALIEDSLSDAFIFKKAVSRNCDHFETLSLFLESGKKYDIIFTDLNLPDSYGVETVSKLREENQGTIAVLSGMAGGYMTGASLAKLINAGADEVFDKNKLSDIEYQKIIKGFLNGLE